MADLGSIGARFPTGEYNNALGSGVIRAYPIVGRSVIHSRSFSVAGTVSDDANAVATRKLLLIDRASGVLVDVAISNASTGDYTLKAGSSSEHIVIALDDAAGTVHNDLVARATPA